MTCMTFGAFEASWTQMFQYLHGHFLDMHGHDPAGSRIVSSQPKLHTAKIFFISFFMRYNYHLVSI